MERYDLDVLYSNVAQFKSALDTSVRSMGLMFSSDYSTSPLSSFIAYAIYNHFFEDKVIYAGDEVGDVQDIFMKRLGYDVSVKFPYWKKKYAYILQLLSDDELNLLQTSKMISSSKEDINSAGGVIQKTANTPTGVSLPSGDNLNITAESSSDVSEETTSATTESSLEVNVDSSSFADKYTNYQGKTSTGSKTTGVRSGEVLREGSIDDLLNILEKLPSSFADEITKEVSKHFEIVYSY